MSFLIRMVPGIPGVSLTRNATVLKPVVDFGFGWGSRNFGTKSF